MRQKWIPIRAMHFAKQKHLEKTAIAVCKNGKSAQKTEKLAFFMCKNRRRRRKIATSGIFSFFSDLFRFCRLSVRIFGIFPSAAMPINGETPRLTTGRFLVF